MSDVCFFFFFFNDTATTEIYTLSLHDALPIWILRAKALPRTLESVRNERARQELQKVLPQITQRPLEQYSELLREDNDHAGGDPDKNQTPSGDPEASGHTE